MFYKLLLIFSLFFNKEDIETIVINKTNFTTTTIVDVDCDHYNNQFRGFSKTYTYNSRDTIEAILSEINRSKPSSYSVQNVRAKMYLIHFSGARDTLCLEFGTVYSLNGMQMEFSDETLIDRIDSLPPTFY